MDLPVQFLERMQIFLGSEYEAFLAGYELPRNFGLRVNTLKISVEDFVDLAPFHLTKIPWIDNGFYYQREDAPARHPFYNAGLYYLQEPSAMTPADILPVVPGERVLDLCAAPGGKATALAAKLRGRGLLVANEISASRAKALLKNLEVFGVKNSFVTNEAPYRLAGQFEEAFDKILVDAPCSGEGMFRKDMANARAWSLDKVEDCAKTQREITAQAVHMLRPGGLLLYSTCTFSPEENEGTVAYLLETHPELELLEVPMYEGFSRGMPELLAWLGRQGGTGGPEETGCPEGAGNRGGTESRKTAAKSETSRVLREAGVFCMENQRTGKWEQLRKCVRIFPHRMGGEGHFLALFRKKEKDVSGIKNVSGAKGASRIKNASGAKGASRGKNVSRAKGEAGVALRGGRPTREDEKILGEFFREVFSPGESIPMEQIQVRGGQVYYASEPLEVKGGISFLRNGLYLGEMRKNRFEPSQSLAMAVKSSQCAAVIDFDHRDQRVQRYLCGETLPVDDLAAPNARGWQLVCVNGYPLGWGKLVGGNLKNKLHPGWRMTL